MKLFLIILLLLVPALLLMSVRLLVGRSFVKFHVDQNKELRKQGIHCVQSQDAAARVTNRKRVKENKQ